MADETRGGVLTRVRTSTLTGIGSTNWLPLTDRGRNFFTAEVEVGTSFVATFIVEARLSILGGTYGATKTIFTSALLDDFPQTGSLVGEWEVRLSCSAYTSGSFVLSVTR